MSQHCIISVTEPGNDVSKSCGITSQTFESWLHALAYNCFALDLINSVVACRVLISLISTWKGISTSMRPFIFYLTSASKGSQYFGGKKYGCTMLTISRAIAGLKIYFFSFS